jgi:hypothetical protein
MTENTSHLAGLWIGITISNTSHSNKPGSTTANERGSQVKNQGQRQCCHTKHNKFPHRPTRDVSLLSGHGNRTFCEGWFLSASSAFSRHFEPQSHLWSATEFVREV